MQIIMGPRQVGKSTVVYQFCDGIDTPYDYFAADGVNRFDTTWIPNHWQEARMKMDLHGDKERILIIDEVQKIDGWSELAYSITHISTINECLGITPGHLLCSN